MSRSVRGTHLVRIPRIHAPVSERSDGASLDRIAVTVEEGARMLGISRATMYKLVMRGDVASFTVGRARRITLAALEHYAGIPRAS